MDSMGDALEGSGGAIPEIAAVVQFLSAHAATALMAVLVALLLIIVLAEIFNPERRAAAAERSGRSKVRSPGSKVGREI